ncbi:MAG: cobalamin-independent methionine synthase II family protein [Proteobacteria bacterium]|nr:cobalamin-independent methionine synthase II family protein [Pseudomonadota bacterium]
MLNEHRILTTHTGSLPRPPALQALFVRRQAGQAVDAAELERETQVAIARIIAKQADAGVDVANDGEQARDGFFLHMKQRLTGLGGAWSRPPRADVERYPIYKQSRGDYLLGKGVINARYSVPKAIGEIRYVGADAAAREGAAFRATLDHAKPAFAETFLTAPSPGIIARAVKNEFYDGDAAYLAALGRALRVEYEAIVAQGFLLQIDAPDLGLERHITYAGRPLKDFLDFVELVIATTNDALVNVPRDRVRLHVCWGNYEGPHDLDVPLRDILPILLKAKVGGLVLPFANGRHAYEYRCLKDVKLADDQIMVAGVIDPLTNIIEHPETVAERLEKIAAVVGDPRRVMACTDCGFDTTAGAGRVTDDIVWAKLAAMRDGARLASERLFGKG